MSTLEVVLIWAVFVVLLPSALGALIALPFWRRGHMTAGNIIGSAMIALTIMLLIWRQLGAYFEAQGSCAGPGCPAADEAVVAFLVMAGLGWLDALILLILGGIVEDRRRRRQFDRSRL